MENSSKDGNTRPHYLLPEKPVCRTRSNSKTGHGTMNSFRLGKKDVEALYCHPAYLAYIQSTSCEILGWMNHRVESRLLGERSATSDMQIDTTLMTERKEELNSLLMKVKEESEKAGLKLNIQKAKIMASRSMTS